MGVAVALPEVLRELLHAREVVERPLEISGSFAIELFAGCAALTLALTMERVPCMCPWDVSFGSEFDVLTHGEVLYKLVQANRLVAVHSGTPCQSMSWGRLPQLRSWSHVKGMPDLNEKQLALITVGNDLAEFTVSICQQLLQHGGYFSVENPCLSWLWALPKMRDLYAEPATAFTIVAYREFGVRYVKPTAILHNMPCLHELWRPKTELVNPIVLRGWLWYDGQSVARTSLASRYPPDLARNMAKLIKKSLDMREVALKLNDIIPTAEGAVDDGFPLPEAGEGGNLGAGSVDSPPADVLDPFVRHGLGSPKGLTQREHIAWATCQHHVLEEGIAINPELLRCLDFEIKNDPKEIDDMRINVMGKLKMQADKLNGNKVKWHEQAAPESRLLIEKLHGPLIQWLANEICYEDQQLVQDLVKGFPYVGEMPPSATACRQVRPRVPGLETEESLRKNRRMRNLAVLAKMKTSEHESDMMDSALNDMDLGAMGPVVEGGSLDLDSVTLTRRLAVREEKSKGWRTRVVDHKTESGINYAIVPVDKIKHDSIDDLVECILYMLRAGVQVELWKRDASQAFRRIPIARQHLDLTWVVFLAFGVAYAAQHRGMPFGTISAVYAWHRVGGFLLCILRRLFLAPGCRYTDDYFGCNRKDVQFTGGHCLSFVADLIGLPCDPLKDAQFVEQMVVLGALIVIDYPRAGVSVQVSPDKAAKWAKQLHQLLADGTCDPGQASKFAGRLSFAVTASCDKVGRAFVKPFYAQSHAPISGHRVSSRLRLAARWWLAFLTLRIPPFRPFLPREHVLVWTDAAGASRWLAAVVCFRNQWFWTRSLVSQQLWDSFVPRSDDQILMQELLAIPLAYSTFKDRLGGSRVTVFIDNDAVLSALLHGSAGVEDANLAIGQIWLDMARMGMGFNAARVESRANIADGPTRDSFGLLQELKAAQVQPVLPDWLEQLWQFPRM